MPNHSVSSLLRFRSLYYRHTTLSNQKRVEGNGMGDFEILCSFSLTTKFLCNIGRKRIGKIAEMMDIYMDM